jgi:hypothetical protein
VARPLAVVQHHQIGGASTKKLIKNHKNNHKDLQK